MAHAYTTSRGKNKKSKLGIRKDANNNAANKLQNQIFSNNPVEFISKASSKLTLTSDNQKPKDNLLKEKESKLLLTAKCSNTNCTNTASNGGILKLCTGCRENCYCSAECQKQHWAEHKSICKEIKQRQLAAVSDIGNANNNNNNNNTATTNSNNSTSTSASTSS